MHYRQKPIINFDWAVEMLLLYGDYDEINQRISHWKNKPACDTQVAIVRRLESIKEQMLQNGSFSHQYSRKDQIFGHNFLSLNQINFISRHKISGERFTATSFAPMILKLIEAYPSFLFHSAVITALQSGYVISWYSTKQGLVLPFIVDSKRNPHTNSRPLVSISLSSNGEVMVTGDAWQNSVVFSLAFYEAYLWISAFAGKPRYGKYPAILTESNYINKVLVSTRSGNDVIVSVYNPQKIEDITKITSTMEIGDKVAGSTTDLILNPLFIRSGNDFLQPNEEDFATRLEASSKMGPFFDGDTDVFTDSISDYALVSQGIKDFTGNLTGMGYFSGDEPELKNSLVSLVNIKMRFK